MFAKRLITLTVLVISSFVFISLAHAQTSPCAAKKSGDADCIADGTGKQTTIVDFQIWRGEFFAGCSSTNSTGTACQVDDDKDGILMDANFDYPGSGYTTTDSVVTIADFEIWRKGYFGGITLTPTVTPVVTVTTIPPTATPTSIPGVTTTPGPAGAGIWISKEEIAALQPSGNAWNSMRSAADASIGSSALYNQDSKHPQSALAVALVAAKMGAAETCGGQNCREKAAAAIMDILDDGPTTGGGDGRVLALGRNLAGYIVAADVIDLKTFKPVDHTRFVAFLRSIQTKSGFPGSCADGLIACHENRPNNWGTMAGASRIALDRYIGDTVDLEKAAKTFKGFIGEPGGTNVFVFQTNAKLYSCSTNTPLNPEANCTLSPPGCGSRTFNMSGASIDDVQRDMDDGVPTCPPYTNYAWGGFSGLTAQAEMLHRAGYPSYDWQAQAMKRGMNFLQTVMATSTSNPTDWVPWVINHHYQTNFTVKNPTGWGRLMGWTDWTHSK